MWRNTIKDAKSKHKYAFSYYCPYAEHIFDSPFPTYEPTYDTPYPTIAIQSKDTASKISKETEYIVIGSTALMTLILLCILIVCLNKCASKSTVHEEPLITQKDS